jgi:hypothetical protein
MVKKLEDIAAFLEDIASFLERCSRYISPSLNRIFFCVVRCFS